jgi:3-phytase
MNTDSVASYSAPGATAWLLATSKDQHLIEIFDAADGTHLRDFGGPGSEPGQFQRPNGILVLDDLLVVVERDNQRVQIFSLPALESIGRFGEAELINPYGAWLQAITPGSYRLYVSDAYETENERVPPPEELDRRVHVFDLAVERGPGGAATAVLAAHTSAFGETSGPGVLNVVESLWGDPAYDRLLIAEEDPAGGRVIKTYSLDGRFTGPVIGAEIFRSQPEGIALFECGDGSGYWITTDQNPRSNVFHLFDRRTLAHVGGFSGAVTRHTDGIWLHQAPLPGFPAGAFFAVHDDQAVAAFDWRDVTAALRLDSGCA